MKKTYELVGNNQSALNSSQFRFQEKVGRLQVSNIKHEFPYIILRRCIESKSRN